MRHCGWRRASWREYARALSFFLEAVQQVLALGIEIKDFDRGLFDFPHLRDGKVVLLCWQRGEDQIEWWHDVRAALPAVSRYEAVVKEEENGGRGQSSCKSH
jgi:hypothetical protein